MSIPGKVTEQIILEVITKHVEVKKIIRSNQHGIMKGKSCLINLRIGQPIYDGVAGWGEQQMLSNSTSARLLTLFPRTSL